MLVAFSPDVARKLNEALMSEFTQKTYYAICRGQGEPLRSMGTIRVEQPVKDKEGVVRDAETELRVLWGSDYPRCCLVRARPRTGRWHQIRKHLNNRSFPILGDKKHGDKRENRLWRERGMPIERLALHMHRLRITVPSNEHQNWPHSHSVPESTSIDKSSEAQQLTLRDILPSDGLDLTCALPNDLISLIELTPWAATARAELPRLFESIFDGHSVEPHVDDE
eukprot:gnl/MRDRNA2_/MRDRNA2_80705_c0_seq1.p1 gnl/MRDRNA2_/MRDRNA2_80705_c0~~gnl/MRDRNA2_/MRDRNA2_80705_c0_seq1.p1  ORF type:complete len:224 (+),score=30.25 gnl/MRDRNA2_/MRDRNA2_80705_c0_seq1:669-1340(+)